ncbi:putative NADPH reductase tah18 [Diplodia seriata]|uniref:Putative NADPH reductase tah18 n=1 Tax=Diplodia seriata TaxID=420778 RepID=A0A1S8B7D1_9PEZI|nr:putative NADPH reductase tah18 [Diplodia seriata]
MAHSALVTYGSETGNAEELAVQLSQLTRRLRLWTTIKPLNALTPQHLNDVSIVLIVISTTGQGDLPRNAQQFFKKLRSRKLASDFLGKCIFTSFGLGDSSYPQLGGVYSAGYYNMSTWIPFVWGLINTLVLILSSFAIQGAL